MLQERRRSAAGALPGRAGALLGRPSAQAADVLGAELDPAPEELGAPADDFDSLPEDDEEDDEEPESEDDAEPDDEDELDAGVLLDDEPRLSFR